MGDNGTRTARGVCLLRDGSRSNSENVSADAVAIRRSSFASINDVKSCIESLGALKKIVIRNSGCCKEMTTMTMFLGVCGSDVGE
jgi:hypothetical protein